MYVLEGRFPFFSAGEFGPLPCLKCISIHSQNNNFARSGKKILITSNNMLLYSQNRSVNTHTKRLFFIETCVYFIAGMTFNIMEKSIRIFQC